MCLPCVSPVLRSKEVPSARLNRTVIALLVHGGVPEAFFLQLLQAAAAEAASPVMDRHRAYTRAWVRGWSLEALKGPARVHGYVTEPL